MSFSPLDLNENTPEPPLSDACLNLDNQFSSMQDLSKAESMRVYARVRPMLTSELEAGYKECIAAIDNQTVRAVVPSTSAKYKSTSHVTQDIIEDFTYSSAFGPEVGQFVFFEESMMTTMQNFIEGQNSLVFSYGSTGSGKTFTLQGNPDNPGIIPLSLHLYFASIENQLLQNIVVKPEKFSDVVVLNDNEQKTEIRLKEQLLSSYDQEEWNCKNSSSKTFSMILCDSFSDTCEIGERTTTLGPDEMAQAQAATLMKELSKKSAEQQSGYCSIWVSFAEIYNEYVYDLLQPNVNQRAKLTLGEDKNGDVYVKGLREVCVSNCYEALKLLNIGQKNLKIASTKLNYQSSRSHCIYTVKVIRIPDPENITSAKVNRLSFCDLAGSERSSKAQTTGLRLKEAGCINTSLLVLGRCLEQLRTNPNLKDKKLVPFRESKLTRLFSGFFTGKGKAVMITNASPSEVTFDETLHVLRFSAVAKELIINDSYIATATSTLQTFTNMWNNARNSLSSDKSISFEEDGEVDRENEAYDKLYEYAEELSKELAVERKERAELEYRIRQEVCQEYSEYSDELLANMRETHEEECEKLKDIYKKRIANMEEMYEKIINDYKAQLEESYSTVDEVSGDASKLMESDDVKKEAEGEELMSDKMLDGLENRELPDKETLFEKDSDYLRDIEALKNDLETMNEELKATKVEMEKALNHITSLEKVTFEMEEKLKISNCDLQNAIKENDELKKQNDFLQKSYQEEIMELEKEKAALSDEFAANFQKEKSVLEKRVKSLSEELVNIRCEKEATKEKIAEYENKIADYKSQIQKLTGTIDEITNLQHESQIDFDKAMTAEQKKLFDADNERKAVLQELKEEKGKLSNLEAEVSSLTQNVTELQSEKKENNKTIRSILKELDDAKSSIASLEEKLQNSETSVAFLKEKNSELNAELSEFRARESEIKKNQEAAIEQLKNNEEFEAEFTEAQKTIHEQAKEISGLLRDIEALKEQIFLQKSAKLVVDKSLSSALKDLEASVAEKQDLDQRVKEAEKCTAELRETISQSEQRISDLEKEKEDIKEKFEIETNGDRCKNHCTSKELKDFMDRIEKQKKEIDDLCKENDNCRKIISELQESKEKLALQMEEVSNGLVEKESSLKDKLDAVSSKLDETQHALNEKEKEMETLKSAITDLEEKLNSQPQIEASHKLELDTVNSKLDKALLLVSEKEKEIQTLQNDSMAQGDQIAELRRMETELENKLRSQQEIENGKLHQMIELLQKCETHATNKAKELHSASIKHVEQLMDLEKTIKNKENCIESLKNDCIALQKQLKDLQASSKKQLQAEKQQFQVEFENLKSQKTVVDKENDDLKSKLSELEKEKDELSTEILSLKNIEETLTKEMHNANDRNVSKAVEENIGKDGCEPEIQDEELAKETETEKQDNKKTKSSSSKGQIAKQSKNVTKKSEVLKERKSESTTKILPEDVNPVNKSKKLTKPEIKKQMPNANKRTRAKTLRIYVEKIDEIKEETPKIEELINQKEVIEPDNKKTKSSNKTASEDKPKMENQKLAMENETKKRDNKKKSNSNKERRIPGRQLKNVQNVAEDLGLVVNKESTPVKSRPLKRKMEDSPVEKVPSMQFKLKKLKMNDINNVENILSPQNLRIHVLKGNFLKNASPKPSPRLTRGRRRLINSELFPSKESMSENKSRRAVR